MAVNAVSLVCALIANLALSLNMARRIHFKVAQPIIIIGWYISSVMMLGLLIAFGVLMDRPGNAGRVFSQAYFYGAFAAGLYFIISSLLVVTAYGAFKGHYSREYKLTTSQRSLMLQTIILFIYLLGGSAVYAKVEHWRFLDALYWADFTIFTIGVGNYAPKTHLGRGLLFPYGVGGILILGLIISSIRTLMLEHGRQRMADILTARTRRFLVKEAFSDHNHLRGLVPHLGADGQGNERNEREQQKREFITMRRIRQLATVQHKWMSLLISLITWMALWLIGAVVFWQSEKHLHWTYFGSVYFAYVTLLTIGYGDLYPVSSLGKAFFVFWTLLAVPAITILISNIGDTIIHVVRDLTLFIGDITILPGDEPFLDRVKALFHTSWTDKWLQEATGERNPRQDDFDGEAADTIDATKSDDRNTIEADEHKKAESARQRGDIAAENVHHYHYLLFREVRKMMDYAKGDLSKEFDYLEWEYYIALISGKHRPVAPAGEGREGAEGADAQGESERESALRDWSWIDKKNPLLGEKSEVEWLLEALTEALEEELRRASRAYHSPEASEGNGDGGENGGEGEGFESSKNS